MALATRDDGVGRLDQNVRKTETYRDKKQSNKHAVLFAKSVAGGARTHTI